MSAPCIVTILIYCMFALGGHCGTIRQVIYDFDETITYQHVFQELRHLNGQGNRISMHEQVAALSDCSSARVVEMFGGRARLRQLHEHWKYLTTNGVDIGVIASYSSREVIIMALERVDLMQYFSADKIVGREDEAMWQGDKLRAFKIKKIAQHFNQFPSGKRLFVDDDRRNMADAEQAGVAKAADFAIGPIYHGLTEPQLAWIRDQCDISADHSSNM